MAEMREMVLDDVFGVSGFELNKEVAVKNTKLGCFKFVLMSLTVVCWLFYHGCFMEKSYLEMMPLIGLVRLQLQHPTEAHCSPTDRSCKPSFAPLEDLPYCHKPGKDPAEVCQYMEEFDLASGILGFGTSSILVPSRRTKFVQDRQCDAPGCMQPYVTSDERSVFVADIENFTLLIDHSFHTEAVHAEARDMQGLVRVCPTPDTCVLRALKNFPAFDDEMKERWQLHYETEQSGWMAQQILQQRKHSSSLLQRAENTINFTKYFWGVSEDIDLKDGYGIPNGDVFRVGYILKDILGIDLDETKNFKNESARNEGLAFLVKIHYKNFEKGTRPNVGPTIYEYEFTRVDFETYKTNTAYKLESGDKRFVEDWHGLFFQSFQQGSLGKFSMTNFFYMLIETSFILSVCRWAVRFIALNWYRGKGGDAFEEVVKEEYEFDVEQDSNSASIDLALWRVKKFEGDVRVKKKVEKAGYHQMEMQ